MFRSILNQFGFPKPDAGPQARDHFSKWRSGDILRSHGIPWLKIKAAFGLIGRPLAMNSEDAKTCFSCKRCQCCQAFPRRDFWRPKKINYSCWRIFWNVYNLFSYLWNPTWNSTRQSSLLQDVFESEIFPSPIQPAAQAMPPKSTKARGAFRVRSHILKGKSSAGMFEHLYPTVCFQSLRYSLHGYKPGLHGHLRSKGQWLVQTVMEFQRETNNPTAGIFIHSISI